jgi:hypothetical protein
MKKFLFATSLLLLALKAVNACSCGGYPAVCESYQGASAVFVGTVRTVENKTANNDQGREFTIGQKAWVQVDRIFKGKVAGEVPFRSYGSSCDPVYKEGQQWLFYAYFNEKERAWEIRACDRSTLLDGANDDLLYLNALPKSSQTTRISGRVEHYETDPERGFSLVKHIMGAKVNILGPKNYEVFTDANGVFEVYGAPPGLYEIRPEIPLGLKLRFPIAFGPTVMIERKESPGGAIAIGLRHKLEEKSCVSIEFVLSANNSIKGKVIGTNGKPLPRVCLELIPVNAPETGAGRTSNIFDCTETDGSYTLDQMPPGQYLIRANYHNKISSDEPFRATYYPGTFDRKQATVITMALGDRRTDYDINIPSQLPTYTLSGVLLFADGKPIPEGFVEFEGIDIPKDFDGKTHTAVDANGRFELPVLAGFKGSLRGYIFTYEGDYLNCPKLDQILKKSRAVDVSSERFPIEVNSDRPNIELRLPFPSCVKAKRE